MKKATVIIISLLFVVSFASLTFAGEKPVEEKAGFAPKAVEKKATAKLMRISGEVRAVDVKANTIGLKSMRGGDITVTCDDKTKIMIGKDMKKLTDIKVGDAIFLMYEEVDGKNVTKSISIRQVMRSKPEGQKTLPMKPEGK